jgi:hypothetical protein
MSVSTTGYICTPVKNVMHVMAMVEKSILKMIREKMSPEARSIGLPEGFAYPSTRLAPDLGMAQTVFTICGEKRMLSVQFNCDSDASERYLGEKIILSMGCSGLSEEVISTVLGSLTHLGRCYVDRNDCDDEPDVPILTAPMTFIDAVVRGYDSPLNFKSWIRNYSEIVTAQACAEYMGLTSVELYQQCTEDSTAIYAICDRYIAVAKAKATAPVESAKPTLLYHSTDRRHRRSIQAKGLLLQKDRTGTGAVFLSDTVGPTQPNIDNWQVTVEGLAVTEDTTTQAAQGNWFMCFDNILPNNLRLLSA